jgi:polar amino acid transport system substrate-binding protein
MNTHRRFGQSRVAAIMGLCLVVSFASALAAQEGGESVRVCTFPAAGFFARDAAGAASGLEYDLLTGFAAASRLKVTFTDVPHFDQLLKDTASGACQIGAATIAVTDERKAKLAFSNPYFPNRVVVVQKTSTAFAQPADLKNRRVAIVKGTLSVSLVGGIAGAKPVLVDDDDAAFQALLKGAADALACDSAVVLHYLKLHADLAIAFPMGDRSFFAFALPQGSKLVAPLNQHLASLQKSGAFTKLLAKHFGEANAEFLAEDVAKVSVKP